MREITSDNFIELFIFILRLEYLKTNEETNLLNATWTFSIPKLKEFIFYSKRDYRYQELLNCFNFSNVDNNYYSVELILALNKAMNRHLITGIYDDIAYISRFYSSNIINSENVIYYYNIIENFVNDFKIFSLNKELYLKTLEQNTLTEEQNSALNNRLVFDLKRKLRDSNI